MGAQKNRLNEHMNMFKLMDKEIYLHIRSKPLMNQKFIASCKTQICLTAAKLTFQCNTPRTSNSFARSGTGVVIDSKPHMSRMCTKSFLFPPLAVRIHSGCFLFSFYTPTKPLIRLHIKFKTVLFPKLQIISIF